MKQIPWAELVALVRHAGEAILPYRGAELAVRAKADESPVTAADLAAHRVLVEGLRALAPDIPVLSEEDYDIPLDERHGWQRWWLVDPLDGTREFISGSEEFTVNVALVKCHQVLFGLVGLPVSGRCYYGGAGLGAWRKERDGTAAPISVHNSSTRAFTVMTSRCHGSPAQERLLAALSERFGDLTLANIGSSLKFCLLAEGAADCYPRLAPTSQWDTAAAQGVLEGAGGEVLDLSGEELHYEPREDFLNPPFLALPKAAKWRTELIQLAARSLD